ncbi:MAG: redoxin domain-containing protein [Armatimonadetes bacterium]|nr:redoxin domain-containing protein [Armatimonadota bacterium]
MSALSQYKLQVFGASVDPVELNKQFAEKNKYNFPLLSDPEKGLARALGVLNDQGTFARRWTYIVDDQGVIRHIDTAVKAATHGKDLAARVAELGIPKK